MRKSIVVITIILMVFSVSYIGKRVLRISDGPSYPMGNTGIRGDAGSRCRRIVSMAPSITETLFALGLGERVVAVTRYCEYPAEAKKRMKIGGYYDANYEAIMGLSPDLVVLLPEQDTIRQFLEKAGFTTLVVDNKTIPDILHGIKAVGMRCETGDRAEELTADLERRMDQVGLKAANLVRPRVLVSIGGGMRSGAPTNICGAGPASFYGQMVVLAGGTNAYRGSLTFPDVSREGIMELNPQVIIDIVVNPRYEPLDDHTREMLMREWRAVAKGTDAERNGRIYLFEKDYAVIPGPRFIFALEDIAKVLHPEGVKAQK